MTLLLPVAAGAALWYGLAQSYDMTKKAAERVDHASQRSDVKIPLQGMYTPVSQMHNVLNRGRFVSVQEDFDVSGARIFLVDYGNGSQVVQYTDPRILL